MSPRDEPEVGVVSSPDASPSTGSLPIATVDTDHKTAASLDDKFVTVAHFGVRFVVGRLEFGLTAIPTELLCTLKMFDAAKRGNLEELKSILESSKSADVTIPYVSVSLQDDSHNAKRFSLISVLTNQGVDINVEYHAPSYSDDHFFLPGFSRRKSSAMRGVSLSSPFSPLSPASCPTGEQESGEQRLLLHIAIKQNYLAMVTFLLSEKADVRIILYYN